jgi:predicted metal-dependent phosphotriesterase family hydrolase
MKKFALIGVGAFVMVGAVAYFVFFNKHGSSEIMSMAKSGASETEMLNAINKNPPSKLSAEDVVQLKQAGVSDTVIIAMLRKNPAQVSAKK